MDRVCFGHVCHDARGLTLLHLPPEHVVLGAVLLVASFLFFYSLAWAWLHRLKGLPARVATFFVLSAGYMLLVLRGIPWHPYWIRYVHAAPATIHMLSPAQGAALDHPTADGILVLA